MLRRGALIVVLVAVAGCGGDDPSCAIATIEGELLSCIEFAGAVSDSDAKASCESNGGSWRDEPCDDTDAVGLCELFGSSTWYYAEYLDQIGTTIEMLRDTCEMANGTFTEL